MNLKVPFSFNYLQNTLRFITYSFHLSIIEFFVNIPESGLCLLGRLLVTVLINSFFNESVLVVDVYICGLEESRHLSISFRFFWLNAVYSLFFITTILVYLMYITFFSACMYVCLHHIHAWSSEEGIRYPTTRDKDGYEPLHWYSIYV